MPAGGARRGGRSGLSDHPKGGVEAEGGGVWAGLRGASDPGKGGVGGGGDGWVEEREVANLKGGDEVGAVFFDLEFEGNRLVEGEEPIGHEGVIEVGQDAESVEGVADLTGGPVELDGHGCERFLGGGIEVD